MPATDPGVIRPLIAADLDPVVSIDAQVTGRSRPIFFARRLEAALREPGAYIYTGYQVDGRLRGFLLARIARDEFGGDTPVASLDAIGVEPAFQRQGIGRRLMAATDEVLARKKVSCIVSQAEWRNDSMLRFFAKLGFSLAPSYILERQVALTPADRWQAAPEPSADASREIDYSRPSGGDPVMLARDAVICRSVAKSDLDALIRIDRRITGRDRGAYFGRLLGEIFEQPALRVSMVAELDNMLAGFVMARVDFGEFARLEPVAVLDTLGVDPGFARRRIATALLSQLLANLGTLHVDRIRTQVRCDQFALMSFFHATGFLPGQDLPFVRKSAL